MNTTSRTSYDRAETKALVEHKQTLALIRRVLAPQAPPNTPLDEILPALTSSSKVDIQLYAIIAIICRDFVYAWYQKISSDHSFVEEIVLVIAHCTRSLEQRFRNADVETVVLDEIPALLENHIKDYRLARERQSTALSPYATVNDIFHSLQPHIALSASPESERLYLKLLGSGILSVLLPSEDLESDLERSLVRELLSGMVLWNVVDRLSEPYMIFEIITKMIVALKLDHGKIAASLAQHKLKEKLELKALLMKNEDPTPNPQAMPTIASKMIQMVEKIYSFTTKTVNIVTKASSTLYRLYQNPPITPRRRKSILQMSLMRFLSTFLSMDKRQPWLVGNLQLASYPLYAQPPGSLIDNYLSILFQSSIMTEEIAVKILFEARDALFPNGALGPPHVYPSEEEKMFIQRQAEEAIWNAIPSFLKHLYLSTDKDHQLNEISEILAFFKSRNCNKHLIYQLIDLVVERLIPELTEEVPSKLRKGRSAEL